MTKSPAHCFPKGFLWGTATSSHQVEGGNINNWSIWEPGHIQDGSISGLACDSYRRFKEDIALAKKLNNNAYRFSIEWSRIEPQPNSFNHKALQHYQAMVDECHRRDIEPVVTIYHWTQPLWFAEIGGWENHHAPQMFNNYVLFLAQNLKGVKIWCTINEPEIYARNSYLQGKWPPQKMNPLIYIKVITSLIKAHRLAYQTLHLASRSCQVGIANNSMDFEPVNNNLINTRISRFLNWWINDYFFIKTAAHHDYIGINYYFHKIVGFSRIPKPRKPLTDMGWEIYPIGLYRVLMAAKKYKLPIYILENGIADSQDQHRAQFIAEHLTMIHRAIQDGCPVKGYFYWSLLDNFEWKWGFEKRFGLYEVDYQSLERLPRPSSRNYAKICKNNGF